MTSPNDPPLSRRAARLAEQSSNVEGVEVFARPSDASSAEVVHRSAGSASAPSSAPTDIAYRTEVRPRVPHYDEAPPALVSPTAPPPPVAPAFIPAAPPAYPVQHVRRRDFRPPTDSPGDAHGADDAAPVDAPLEYHTQLTPPRRDAQPRFEPPVESAPVHVIETVAHVEPLAGSVEHTMSRRELREIRAAQGLVVQQSAPEPVVHATIEPTPVEPANATTPPAPVVQASAPEPVVPTPVTQPEFVEHAQSEPVVPASTGSHWSVGIHDADDPFENTFSREVGSSTALNTNALVLPEMPTGSIAGPVAGTGEIIVTGMIDVSRVVSSTGTVPTMHDSPDIDDVFEPGDLEIAPPDSAPVSALKAVSSHTGTHTVMTGKRSTSNTVTTVLVATTVVMAVVAIGLFIVAAVNGLF